MPISVLAAFLNLGRKYEIDHIRQQAIKRLAAAFPSELNTSSTFKRRGMGNIIRFDPIAGDIHRLANLIRENDLLVHLPMVLLACISRDHSEKISIFIQSPETHQPILSYADIELCHKAHLKLMQLQTTKILAWMQPWEVELHCDDSSCDEWRQKLHRFTFNRANIPLYIFEKWIEAWSTHLCQECDMRAKCAYAEGQINVFEMLPSMFNLPGWEELREKWCTVCRQINSCLFTRSDGHSSDIKPSWSAQRGSPERVGPCQDVPQAG